MGLKYYGRKESILNKLMMLLPEEQFTVYVEPFFGSGCMAQMVVGLDMVDEIVGYELDRSLFTLHQIIKDEVLLEELIERIPQVKNSRENFKLNIEKLKLYNAREIDADTVDIALRELECLYFSRNSARNAWRNTLSYQKFESPLVRAKKRVEMEAIEHSFYMLPVQLLNLHNKYKGLSIYNDDGIKNMEKYATEETFFFVDPPYLPEKRGLSERKSDRPKNAGYMEDLTRQEHSSLIEKILSVSKKGAKVMVCSNFEIEPKTNELIGTEKDPYVRLMRDGGFRLVVVKKCYSTNPKHEMKKDSDGKCKQKKTPKAEVVFINYTEIMGNWGYFKYYDYDDLKCE